MSYYTYYNMDTKSKILTPEVIEEINKWLKERSLISYALCEGEFHTDYHGNNYGVWDGSDLCEWHDHEEDMEALSRAFPEVAFCLHGNGEDQYDKWDEYWLNGECEACRAKVYMPKPIRIKW